MARSTSSPASHVMTPRQPSWRCRLPQTISIAGLLTAAVMCLYPPYYGVMVRDGDNLTEFVGYASVFSGPSKEKIASAFLSEGVAWYSQKWSSRFSSRIDSWRLICQLMLVGFVVGVLLLLFRPGKAVQADRSRPIRDSGT